MFPDFEWLDFRFLLYLDPHSNRYMLESKNNLNPSYQGNVDDDLLKCQVPP